MDFTSHALNNGLKYTATSSFCTKALAFMMGANYTEEDVAKIMATLFCIKAKIPCIS
jgi:hypothetical protein